MGTACLATADTHTAGSAVTSGSVMPSESSAPSKLEQMVVMLHDELLRQRTYLDELRVQNDGLRQENQQLNQQAAFDRVAASIAEKAAAERDTEERERAAVRRARETAETAAAAAASVLASSLAFGGHRVTQMPPQPVPPLPAMMMMHPMLSQTPWGQMSFHPVMSAANPMAGWGVPVPASSQQRAPLETPSPLETRDPYPHGQSLQPIPPSDGSEPAPGANSEQAPLATTPREILNGSSSVPQNALTKRQLEEANEPTAATRGAAPGP
jgi:hypothetical protein